MTTTASTNLRPEPTAPRDYRFPRWQRHRMGNGMQLVIAPVRRLPIVTLSMLIDAGAVSEQNGEEGVANLTVQALVEGTTQLTGSELAEKFERLGGSLNAGASWDFATLTTTVLSGRLQDAFKLFSEVLRSPALPEREVLRLKTERLVQLLQLRAEPRGLADEMFARFIYQDASRYAIPEDGSATTVARLDPAIVEAFYKSRYLPGGMTLVVVGDVDADSAIALAERNLGDWATGTPERVSTSDQAARSTRAVHIVSKADAPQSEIRLGHVGLPRVHSDHFPVLVMNAVLGGLFSSRINLNLREVHGYTYGAFSLFDWRRQAGPFYVSTAVKSEVTGDAVREILLEIDRIRSQGIGSDELSLATSYLEGVFPIKYETTAAIAQALSALVVYGLADDYFDTYRRAVRSVTITDVLIAAESHLHPELLQLLVVGDPAVVREPLEQLGFGALGVYDSEGAELRS
ncbi:MAG: insulinase family protein [Gemmatimonadaceae bacterium]|nr:insulinase family protein [Gemmatimonadaceae bacterium]MDQ3519340.1 insulinase family protein [Gemmatimonadota bacterium]